MTFVLPTVADTQRLGAALARLLRPGDLIVLNGPLGAGKTAFTQGIGAELGVAGPITSPTFIIARVHPPQTGTTPLVHVDAYRLGGLDELDDLDLDASIDESITVVEWGSGVVEQLVDAHLEVNIERRDDDVREMSLIGHGGDWDTRIKALTEATC